MRRLDPAQLRDRNTLALVFPTPAGGLRAMTDNAQGGKRWVTLRATTPAAPWQRRVFNGQAQVILQSTGASGPATLRARGEGLPTTTFTIDAF